MANLNDVQRLIDQGRLQYRATEPQGDVYLLDGGNSGYVLVMSKEWTDAKAEAARPWAQGDGGTFFWSDGDRAYFPSPLAAQMLAGTAKPNGYIVRADELPSFSVSYGDPNWHGGGLGGALLAGAGLAALAFSGFALSGALTEATAATVAETEAATAIEATTATEAATATEGTTMFDDFGNIINADGTLSDPGGSWNLTDAEINSVAEQAIGNGSPLSGMPTTYGSTAATNRGALDDVLGSVRSISNGVSGAIRAYSGAVQATRNNLGTGNPTASLGSLNFGTLALAAAALIFLKG